MANDNSPLPQKTYSSWDGKTRILAAFFLVVFGVLAITLIKPVFAIVVLGFLFSFILFYPIKAVAKKMPKHYTLAEGIIFLVVIILFVFIIFGLLQNIIAEAQKLGAALGNVDQAKVQNLISASPNVYSWLTGFIKSISSSLISTTAGLVNGTATLFTGIFVAFLLMMNMHGGRGKMTAWVPAAFTHDTRQLLSAMDQMWVRYMLVQVIYATCNAVAAYLLFLIAGVPYPLPLALIVGVLSVIPVVGGILGSVIIGAACLVLGSTKFTTIANWQFALIVMTIQFLISQGIYLFIGLPLTGRMVKLPIVVVLIGAMIGLSTGNILIAFLSVPLISTAKVFGSYLLAKALDLETNPIEEFKEEKEPGFFSQLMAPKEESRDSSER
jgi:predicted PurR-regulated permease PerM